MTRLILTFLLLACSFGSGYAQSTIVIIGNVHHPSSKYNADTLYNILDRIKPDIILLELDSPAFTKIFSQQHPSKENEPTAALRYLAQHPHALIAPFEFEGRDNFRREKGIRQASGRTDKLLDSLYKNNLLTRKQRRIVAKYYALTDTLAAYVEKPVEAFNNARTDSLCRLRQYYQHARVRSVINQRGEFVQQVVKTSLQQSVTLREAYNSMCDFWDLRNKTMADNILLTAAQHPGKRIVVLTGFFHRYYLIEAIKAAKAPHRLDALYYEAF